MRGIAGFGVLFGVGQEWSDGLPSLPWILRKLRVYRSYGVNQRRGAELFPKWYLYGVGWVLLSPMDPPRVREIPTFIFIPNVPKHVQCVSSPAFLVRF
jgi:hypothetical protein